METIIYTDKRTGDLLKCEIIDKSTFRDQEIYKVWVGSKISYLFSKDIGSVHDLVPECKLNQNTGLKTDKIMCNENI